MGRSLWAGRFTPGYRTILVRYQHDLLDRQAMGDVDELDDQHILMQARELKNGVWIERILVQMRRSLCGMGVETFKDVPDKVI